MQNQQFNQHLQRSSRVKVNRKTVTWSPSLKEWFKINTNATFKTESAKGETSAILKDISRSMLTGSVNKIYTISALSAEAEAIRRGIIVAKNLNFQKVVIESDNLLLVQILKSKLSIAEVDVILHDIQSLSAETPNCGFTWTTREGNKAANFVASLATTDNLRSN
ncbi:hypothetical protein PIB30_013094 [Stylosanthes scabra]|uniref:RNase H type-1 domain-containing protein n=1 Tax=Stylosanthes scabra TaxID=79078 RepID=A0ABU6V6A2_9FABA|nr:hypothetical protein [Stylosanthes scabra]